MQQSRVRNCMPAINLHTTLMSFFHTFLWMFLYKKRHFAIAIHNQLKNYQEIFSSLQESTLHHHSSSIMATAAPTPAPAPTPFLATPRAWTLTTLLQLLLQGEDAITAWLMAKGLLASSRQCPKCASSWTTPMKRLIIPETSSILPQEHILNR